MSDEICPVCFTGLQAQYEPWHLVCGACAYEKALLKPAINIMSAHDCIDEGEREAGLRILRSQNFRVLLEQILAQRQPGGSLLEVGCAHGWFLDIAKEHYSVLGLEPDKDVFEATASRGVPVKFGYFPNALESNEKFDVIVFNDVIEHIPDIDLVLGSCHEHLKDGGFLVLNLPSSNGFFYKFSKVFAVLGYPHFFERMWQKGLPSPHLHYFNRSNLTQLVQKKGFSVKKAGRLSTLRLSGLYTRISYTGGYGFFAKLFLFLGVAFALPLLKFLPSDIFYVISTRVDKNKS